MRCNIAKMNKVYLCRKKNTCPLFKELLALRCPIFFNPHEARPIPHAVRFMNLSTLTSRVDPEGHRKI